ncbi:MAG: GNAT family N-acetyltransferase [Gammaproteobacteria bacterium]|nr:GNAT family N-acetyltransferase [Gammaproteobacteria bacterium]
MTIEIRVLGEGDAAVLDNVAEGVFDNEIVPDMARRFLADSAHHMVVALEDGVVVGMASGNDYLHPDKPVMFWVNEMGVAPSHQRRGIGKKLLQRILDRARELGREEAWLGTEVDNVAARALYKSLDGEEESFVMYTYDFSDKEETR